MVTVIPGLTLDGILNRNSFLPGGAGEEALPLLPPLLPPLVSSSVNTATAFITSHPTASNTCLERDASKPISTHVLTAVSFLEPPLLLPLLLLEGFLLGGDENDAVDPLLRPLKELEAGLDVAIDDDEEEDGPRLG